MNLLDPFEGEDDDSDQENAPPCPPQPPPAEPAVVPQPPQQQPVVEDVVKLAPITPQSKRRSRSRASSTSSNTSTSSHTKKGKGSDSGRPSKSRRAVSSYQSWYVLCSFWDRLCGCTVLSSGLSGDTSYKCTHVLLITIYQLSKSHGWSCSFSMLDYCALHSVVYFFSSFCKWCPGVSHDFGYDFRN